MAFTQISRSLFHEIKGLLDKGKGRVVIGQNGYNSQFQGERTTDMVCHVYDSPTINVAEIGDYSLSTNRDAVIHGGERFQQGWQRDREFILRPLGQKYGDPLTAAFRERASKLVIQGYELKPCFESVVGMSVSYVDQFSLYVPREDSMSEAFRAVLNRFVPRINKTAQREVFTEEDISLMSGYMVREFEEGRHFFENVHLGVQADIAIEGEQGGN